MRGVPGVRINQASRAARGRRARAGLALAAVLTVAGCGGEESVAQESLVVEATDITVVNFRFTIPAGAGEAMDAGEGVDLLPAELNARVGQVLEIINQDDRGHLVGPFYVGAGEVLRQEFASPGTYIGECSVHTSGEIVINVTE